MLNLLKDDNHVIQELEEVDDLDPTATMVDRRMNASPATDIMPSGLMIDSLNSGAR